MNPREREIADKFLNLYWYLPFHGLWRGIEAAQLTDIAFEEPILDLGCGHGKFASQYFDAKLEMGLDLSYKALKRAKNVQTYKQIVLTDAARVSVCDDYFATVFSNCAIEHMPDLRGVLEEVFRVLRPGGVLVFTVPSHLFGEYLFLTGLLKGLGLTALATWYAEARNKQKAHFHCYDHETWNEMLEDTGFEMVRYKYYLCRAVIRAWDISQLADFGYGRVRLSNLIKRIASLLERAGVNSLRRLSTKLFGRLFQGLYATEGSCSANNVGGGLMIVARKPVTLLDNS